MKVMRRDVNFGLLLIIVATLVCFSAFAVYYQNSFRNLSSNYYGKLDELDKVANQLTLEKGKLNQTSYQLQIKEQRESELSDIYTDLRQEKEAVEAELKDTQDRLKAKNDDLLTAQSDLSKVQAELTSTQSDLEDAYKTIEDKKDQINDLEHEIEELCQCS